MKRVAAIVAVLVLAGCEGYQSAVPEQPKTRFVLVSRDSPGMESIISSIEVWKDSRTGLCYIVATSSGVSIIEANVETCRGGEK